MSRNAYSDIKCCWTASLAKQNDQYLKKLGWYSYLPVHHFSQCIILNDEFQPAFPFIWLLSRPDSMLRSPLKCRWSLPYLIPSSFCFSVFLQVCLGEGDGTPLQYSCLENPMGGGAWWAAVHGVAKSQTPLSFCVFVKNGEILLANRFFWLITLKMDVSLDWGKPGTFRNVCRCLDEPTF